MTLMTNRPFSRAALGGLGLAVALLAASCGGSVTSPGTSFHPTRIVAYGDETSVILDINHNGDGAKYGVNATVGNGDLTLACNSFPLWIQVLANRDSLLFPQCNYGTGFIDQPTSRIRAAYGAVAADLSNQIATQINETPIGSNDLSTVLVGVNDVINQYQLYPMQSEVQITAAVAAAGVEAGRQVNRLADAGTKVLIATIPDVGRTPFALAEQAAHVDTDRAALLTRLSVQFNASLRSTMTNDGKRIGIILLDEFIDSVSSFPGLNGYVNSTVGICNLTKSSYVPPSVLDCTDQTLYNDGITTNGSAVTSLWADDRHLSAGAQTSLGNLAVQRVDTNPF